jgi:hypothetical protein
MLLTTDLTDPGSVAAAFERSAQEDGNAFFSFVEGNEPGRQTQHVGVVVLASQGRQFGVSAQGRPYAGVLVGRNGHAVAAPANEYAEVKLSLLHGRGQRVAEFRIINGSVTERTGALAGNGLLLQQLEQFLFVREPGMVAPNCYK